MPSILETGEKQAVKAALDQVERDKAASGSVEFTTDGALEGSVNADKWHTHITGYVKKKFVGTKELIAGVRASWSFGKK